MPCDIHKVRTPIASTVQIFLSVCICLLLEGCCSAPLRMSSSKVNEFKQKHPNQWGEYLYLNPVNLDTYRCMLGLQLAAISEMSREINLKFSATKGVREYTENEMKQQVEECKKVSQHYSELEALCLPEGTICQFAWTNSTTKEIGLLVIRQGNIIKRDVWIVDYLKDK